MAAPAYNSYKKHATQTALQSELSNLVKAYNAKNAVAASYCHTFNDVGFRPDENSPLYAKVAFLGFGSVDSASCNIDRDTTKIHIETDDDKAGSCSDNAKVTKTDCDTVATNTWTADVTISKTQTPDTCRLAEDQFLAGAGTAVSALNIFYTVNEDGIKGTQTATSSTDLDNKDCIDPAPS